MNAPQISLIISFYNKIQILEKVLESVAMQTFRRFEVIIADDGSKESVVERIGQLQKDYSFTIKHIWHEDIGWRKNEILNKAVCAAQTEYLVFIDGDCILESHFLEDHYNARQKGEVVTGRRVMLTRKVTEKLLAQKLSQDSLKYGLFFQLLVETIFRGEKTLLERMIRLPKFLRNILIKERKRFILGCNFSLHKSDLLSVNGFDERFQYPGYGEDIDLEFRLARKGIPSVSRKCQLVQFHCYHKHFDTNYEPNKKLLLENTENNITYTPYGICK